MKPELTYLATPYSHYSHFVRVGRFEVANACAGVLFNRGVYVYSPISHTHPIALKNELPIGWDYWEAYDTRMISACDTLTVLTQTGWSQSTGVTAEIQIAKDLGKPVKYMQPSELLNYAVYDGEAVE